MTNGYTIIAVGACQTVFYRFSVRFTIYSEALRYLNGFPARFSERDTNDMQNG